MKEKLCMGLSLGFLLIVFFAYSPVYAHESVFIPWEFNVYEEPDFRSEVLGRFDAQKINIRGRHDGGWVRISTYQGTGWVNVVNSPALCALDEFFAPLGNNISVFYKNLETGFSHTHNPGRIFFAASLSKLNHALYVYKMAERGYTDMYQVHTYTARDAWGGTGIMQWKPFGTELTTRELLGLSIRESDNTAYRMLIRMHENHPVSYQAFVREIGANPRMVLDIVSQNTTIEDAAHWMYAVHNYIESDSKFGHYLQYDMMNTAQTSHHYFTRWEGSFGIGGEVDLNIIQSDYPFARKYGWTRRSFHDAAIVYAPSPYILIILSNMDRGAHELFAEISWFIQDFNNRTFVSPRSLGVIITAPADLVG